MGKILRQYLLILCFVIAASAAACSYGYQARDYWGIGYSEVEIEPAVYFVEYTGSDQSMAEVVGFWHRRAKELCQQKQKQGYEMMRPQADSGGQTGAIVPLPGVGYIAGSTDYPRHTGYIRCTDTPTTLFPTQSR